MKKVVSILLGFFLWQSVALAETAPLDVVRDTSNQVIEQLKGQSADSRNDPEKLDALVAAYIVPSFDFPRMSRWVLGKNWRSASDDQKTRFIAAFQSLLIGTYTKALLQAENVVVNYLPVNAKEGAKKVLVKTEVDRQNGSQPIPINYRLYHSKDKWKVYDVAVDGISLVSTYRGSFNSRIKKNGLDSLIADLENRNM